MNYYRAFLMAFTLIVTSNSYAQSTSMRHKWANKDIFYIADTIKVDSAYLLTLKTDSGIHTICLFNLTVKQIDSLLISYNYNFEKFMDNGFAVKNNTSVQSYMAKDMTSDKKQSPGSSYFNFMPFYDYTFIKRYIYNNHISQLSSINTHCFITGIISSDYYESNSKNKKLIRIAFPSLCNEVGF